tara:strand:- start:2010 stop:2300 length:291 start_codon:yes stop_codon:yes gene_type:complete
VSRTRKREKSDFDDAKYVPPLNPLYSQTDSFSSFCDGDLVLGLVPDYENEDMIPRVGIIIKADIDTAVNPAYHTVLWSDGEIETIVEDELAPVAHC